MRPAAGRGGSQERRPRGGRHLQHLRAGLAWAWDPREEAEPGGPGGSCPRPRVLGGGTDLSCRSPTGRAEPAHGVPAHRGSAGLCSAGRGHCPQVTRCLSRTGGLSQPVRQTDPEGADSPSTDELGHRPPWALGPCTQKAPVPAPGRPGRGTRRAPAPLAGRAAMPQACPLLQLLRSQAGVFLGSSPGVLTWGIGGWGD